MSQTALCKGVRDYLQKRLGLSEYECDVTPDGKPHPKAGEYFYSVHEGGDRSSSAESLDEYHSVKVTISIRTGFTPVDHSAAEAIHKAKTGLLAMAEKVKSLIHMDPEHYLILQYANAYLLADVPTDMDVYGFSQPLIFQNMQPSVTRGSAWFWSDTPDPNAGLSVTCTFGEARRLQPIGIQT